MKDLTIANILVLLLGSTSAGAQEYACPPVPGADEILRAGSVVQIGEIHGTVQVPQALAHLACAALERGLDVTVGLEIPQSEDEKIQTYLQSNGGPWNRVQMLAGEFWQRDYQDGRSSQAMADLLEDLRLLASSSGRLRVLLIDNSMAADRDLFMARWLKFAIDADPDRFFLTLTGNLHSRQSAIDNRYFPMGYHLTEMFPEKPIVSLEVTHEGGSAWVCTPNDCGIQEFGGASQQRAGINLYADLTDAGIAGTYHVGRMQASPPAKQR